MNTNKITPGKWELYLDDPKIIVCRKSAFNVVLASSVITDSINWRQAEANAHFIVSAQNACFEINPDNPQAVIDALPELIKALELTKQFLPHTVITQLRKLQP